MKIKPTLFLMILVASLLSCAKDIPNPNCATVLCAYQPLSLKIKYIDKNTHQNLLSAANYRYSVSDVKVSSSRLTNYAPTVVVDNTDSRIVIVENLGTGDLITLGDLAADRISISTKALGEDCCAPYAVVKLQINNKTICQPCDDLDENVIIIEK